MSGAVRTFERKLRLFQLQNINLHHSSSCNLLHKDGSVSVPFPSVYPVETIHSVAENFKMDINDFCNHAANTCIFENPFHTEIKVLQKNCNLNKTD
jgi:hypothetical protein